eukprot:365861-Chlamydomonas_euryale.AAC.41
MLLSFLAWAGRPQPWLARLQGARRFSKHVHVYAHTCTHNHARQPDRQDHRHVFATRSCHLATPLRGAVHTRCGVELWTAPRCRRARVWRHPPRVPSRGALVTSGGAQLSGTAFGPKFAKDLPIGYRGKNFPGQGAETVGRLLQCNVAYWGSNNELAVF